MGVNVTKNVTTVLAENGTTVEVTSDVTNVAVADGTATLTVNPNQTVVNVSGNTSAIDVVAQPQTIRLIDDAYVASEGNSTITNGSLDILAGNDKAVDAPVLGLHTKTAQHGRYIELQSTHTRNVSDASVIGKKASLEGNSIYIAAEDAGLIMQDVQGTKSVLPCDNDGNYIANGLTFGSETYKFINGYFGNAFVDELIVGNQVHGLDAFEHGTFTATASTPFTTFINTRYIRTNDIITISISLSLTLSAPNLTISGLPFTHTLDGRGTIFLAQTPNGVKYGKLGSGSNSFSLYDEDLTTLSSCGIGGYSFMFQYRR